MNQERRKRKQSEKIRSRRKNNHHWQMMIEDRSAAMDVVEACLLGYHDKDHDSCS